MFGKAVGIENLFIVLCFLAEAILVHQDVTSWFNKGEHFTIEQRCREVKRRVKNIRTVSFVLSAVFFRTKYPKKLP